MTESLGPPQTRCKAKKRPKVKGCYQCARRRIDCDGARPSCVKCEVKGIGCSRDGLNYRFCDGIAARGRLAGKSVAAILSYSAQDTFTRPDRFCIPRTLDHMDAESRGLLSYFSSALAPIINVTSGGFNGYRELILPVSENDALVRSAVVLAAREHIAARAGLAFSAPALSTRITLTLLERSQKTPPHQDDSAMATLLMMQTISAISGTDDFRFSFSPLRSLVTSQQFFTGNTDSELAKFVKVQIMRIYLFGETVLDESRAVEFLSTRHEDGLSFLRLHQGHHALTTPHDADASISDVIAMTKMACDIYLNRATVNPPHSATLPQVESFIQLARAADAQIDRFGAHLIAWACFIVAAESSTAEHRAFFHSRFTKLLEATGCLNIQRAIEQLESLWKSPGVRWTSILGGPTQALIM